MTPRAVWWQCSLATPIPESRDKAWLARGLQIVCQDGDELPSVRGWELGWFLWEPLCHPQSGAPGAGTLPTGPAATPARRAGPVWAQIHSDEPSLSRHGPGVICFTGGPAERPGPSVSLWHPRAARFEGAERRGSARSGARLPWRAGPARAICRGSAGPGAGRPQGRSHLGRR